MADEASNENAVKYLSSFLSKRLRIRVSDQRLFTGDLKCTDKDRNIILANAHEYREPSRELVTAAAAQNTGQDRIRLNMTSRYVGLIVIPGEHITKIEVEEYLG